MVAEVCVVDAIINFCEETNMNKYYVIWAVVKGWSSIFLMLLLDLVLLVVAIRFAIYVISL